MMTLLAIVLAFVCAAAVLILAMIYDWHLIPEAKRAWRLWSVRLNALGLMVLSWFTFDPVSVLAVWNMMPRAVTDFAHPRAVLVIGVLLFALSLLARLVQQPKVRK